MIQTILIFCIVITSASPILAAPCTQKDTNARGFCELQQGKIKQAHAFFEKAMTNKSAYPFINHARTTTLLNQNKSAGCPLDTNWIWLALSDLTSAAEYDSNETKNKIDEDSNQWLKVLKEKPEYKLWYQAAFDKLPDTQKDLREWIMKNPHMHSESTGVASSLLNFNDKEIQEMDISGVAKTVATYQLNNKNISVALNDSKLKILYALKRDQYFFNEGKNSIIYLIWEPLSSAGITQKDSPSWFGSNLIVGPILHDCL